MVVLGFWAEIARCGVGGVADAFKVGIRGSRGGAPRESPARIAAVIAGERCAEARGAG